MRTIASQVTLTFPAVRLTGDLVERDGDIFLTIEGEAPEPISTDLVAYGFMPFTPRGFFVKDCSEHKGLAQSIVDTGLGQITRSVTFGPFGATAHEVILHDKDWGDAVQRIDQGIATLDKDIASATTDSERERLTAKREALRDGRRAWEEYQEEGTPVLRYLMRWARLQEAKMREEGRVGAAQGYDLVAHYAGAR